MDFLGELFGKGPTYNAPLPDPEYQRAATESLNRAIEFNSADYNKKRIADASKAAGLLGNIDAARKEQSLGSGLMGSAFAQRSKTPYGEGLSTIERDRLSGIKKNQAEIGKAYGYVNKINGIIAQNKQIQMQGEIQAMEARNKIISDLCQTGGQMMGQGMGQKAANQESIVSQINTMDRRGGQITDYNTNPYYTGIGGGMA